MDTKNKRYVDYIHNIKKKTIQLNKDNISRTKSYQQFFIEFPEIKWAFLASMVSRNAGWNMTDLVCEPFTTFLSDRIRKQLFSTYERANWLIFSDAYPQLLLYKLSVQMRRPLFHLLTDFSVSTFMKHEWFHFWKYNNKQRLLVALIINEQNVIQEPVTNHPFYKRHVFINWPYLLQDFFHMSNVLFPTRENFVYAIDVHDFSNLSKRIALGKRLATILFKHDLFDKFYDFALHKEHTASRNDYECYLSSTNHVQNTPMLRDVYPIIDHQDKIRTDWYIHGGIENKWWKKTSVPKNHWKSFRRKRKMMVIMSKISKHIRTN